MFQVFGLVVILAAALASLNHDPSGYSYHQHTLVRPYDDGHDMAHWDFGGSTVISDHYIRLTPDRQSRRGSLWNKIAFDPPPLLGEDLSKYPSWEAVIEFRVHGAGVKLFGDGFAFWYTKDNKKDGPVFGNQDDVSPCLNSCGVFLFFSLIVCWTWNFLRHVQQFATRSPTIYLRHDKQRRPEV